MTDTGSLFFFSVATLLVVIAPGPGMLFVISRGMAGGQKAGVTAAFGTSAGIAVHIVVAALGLSFLIYASKTGFLITKWVGGVYLMVLAWKSFRGKETVAPDREANDTHTKTVFGQGVLVNALNPKVALFFLAFIPQFVDPSSPTITAQTVVLGSIFLVFTVIVFTAYGCCAAFMRRWIVERKQALKVMDWMVGGLFVFLGVRLILSGPAY